MSRFSPVDVDPADPRAPSSEVWAKLSEAERRSVLTALPDQVNLELSPPEGDRHRKAKEAALDELAAYFQKLGRRVYLSSEINVYYPGEPVFVPDVLAVLDTDPHDRSKWVVSAEGKGLDLVLEVMMGSEAKDLGTNVERYARLGIVEYFVFDRQRARLHGFGLPAAKAREYQRLVPQAGRWYSEVLQLSLGLELDRLRFYAGTAPVPGTQELLNRANGILGQVLDRYEALEREVEEQRRQIEQEKHRADELARELARAREELEKLRR